MMPTYTTVSAFEKQWWPHGKGLARRYAQTAADAAYAYINSALDNCYTVPFTAEPNAPGIVKLISDLLSRAIVVHLQNKGRMPRVRDLKEKAGDDEILNPITMLRNICAGELSVVGATRRTDTGAWLSANALNNMHIFDLDHEIWHAPDRDLLDSIIDERVDS